MKLTAIGLIAMVAIVMQLSPTMACDVIDLQPCLLPIINPPEPPTAGCCQALRDQGPCMCYFIKNTWIGPTIQAPNGHKLFADCNVPYPSC
ncbi:hypothetical protein HID58_023761 [Brassica napus]|uniref:Bifunctional inhibitor/plant lipid transfer protein/seed storage helical domain-containing protein n=2 Tax=Brassica TaxID=3705 RepID=A0ABQ8D314_BRANA|nr:hypothetical protein HID58_023761 [Brassica napus]